MTMAASLEVRVPYCDHRLVEYVWNIPWEMKNYGGHPKGILRLAAERWLPSDVVYRRKSPYPSTVNPSYFYRMADRLQAILEDTHSPLRPLVNQTVLRHMITAGPDAAQIPWFGQLMGNAQLFAFLIQTDAWLRHYHVTFV